jgi:hypothetical protein
VAHLSRTLRKVGYHNAHPRIASAFSQIGTSCNLGRNTLPNEEQRQDVQINRMHPPIDDPIPHHSEKALT